MEGRLGNSHWAITLSALLRDGIATDRQVDEQESRDAIDDVERRRLRGAAHSDRWSDDRTSLP